MRLLNKVHATFRRRVPGFLKFLLSRKLVYTCVSVCPPLRLLITTHIIQNCTNQLNKCYNFPVTAYDIIEGRGLSNKARHERLSEKTRQRCIICYKWRVNDSMSPARHSTSVIKVSKHTHIRTYVVRI